MTKNPSGLKMDHSLNTALAHSTLTEEIIVELNFEDWLEDNHVYTGNLFNPIATVENTL